MDWVAYLDWDEWGRHSKMDYYLAQIAHYVRLPHVKEKDQGEIADRLLVFNKQSEKSGEQKSEHSKSIWMGWMKTNNKVKRPKRK